MKIPENYPVQPLGPNDPAKDRATCGHCGLSWDDGLCTSITPAPAARCPFEPFHAHSFEPDSIASIHISGRRWFQRTYGNTYHTVAIFITFKNGHQETLNAEKQYGYGDQYNQTAIDIFRNRFKIPKEQYSNGNDKYPYLTSYCRSHSIPYTIEVNDVRREKDL